MTLILFSNQLEIKVTGYNASVTATVANHVITNTEGHAITDQPAITGTYIVPVTREGVTKNLTVYLKLTPEPDLTNIPITGVTLSVIIVVSQSILLTLIATVPPD